MDQARIEILKMVSEQKITVEEAERLLAALEAGAEKQRRPGGSAAGRGSTRTHRRPGSARNATRAIRRAPSGASTHVATLHSQ